MAPVQTIKPEPEFDDEWVMQVIREAQEEQKQNPITPAELVAEFRKLARYGAKQAKKVGINVEDDQVINRLVHEERARWKGRQKNSSSMKGIRKSTSEKPPGAEISSKGIPYLGFPLTPIRL